PFPFSERRRATADIDRDIENLARGHTNQLPLRLTDLVVQPTQHAFLRARVVVLDEPCVDSRALEFPLVPALEEEAARVAEYARLNKQYVGNPGRSDFHVRRGSDSLRSSDIR